MITSQSLVLSRNLLNLTGHGQFVLQALLRINQARLQGSDRRIDVIALGLQLLVNPTVAETLIDVSAPLRSGQTALLLLFGFFTVSDPLQLTDLVLQLHDIRIGVVISQS